MSVKELRFAIDPINDIVVKFENDLLIIKIPDGNLCELDRNQAHLLMLYLQEHLKNDLINKKLWYCNKCRVYHSKDHVCVRI